MATAIAEYYLDELVTGNAWSLFYNHEMDEVEKKLGEVIQRNTIPGNAAKVERELNKLNAVSGKFQQLHLQIMQQVASLKTDSTLIDDALMEARIEKFLFGQLYQECLVLYND